MIAPGYPQPTNATRRKWFRSIFIFFAGCHPATSAAPAANAGWLTDG
jgi:hypothetical protein